jgi:TonB family protein
MRIIKPHSTLRAFMLFLAIAAPSLCLAQASQEIDVSKLLAETGYKYTEYEKGRWLITGFHYEGENLKLFDIYLDPNQQKKSLRISLRLGYVRRMAETAEFKQKQADLNKRYEPTEFVLSNSSLFAMRDLPANNLDRQALAKGLESVAKQADQTHPELAGFIELEGKPSVGAGMGGGIGSGDPNSTPYVRPETPRDNVARSVDTKPVLLSRIRPQYTDAARENKVSGVVVVRVLVDETGEVKRVNVVRSLPDGLTETAVEAARKSKFRPAMKDGKPVAYYVLLNIEFNLR